MIVLGIDPGTANTGFGLAYSQANQVRAVDYGVIETPPAMPLEKRLLRIFEDVQELIQLNSVVAVALESVYFGRNVHSALAVGHARGAAMLAAGKHDISCASYTPQQVKAAVCGSGRADKDQVERMVRNLLQLQSAPMSDHAADALAVAICHLNQSPLAQKLAVMAK